MVCYFFETIQELCLAPRDICLLRALASIIIKLNSDFHYEWRLQAESGADLLGDDGDADGDVVTDQADGLTIIMRCAVPVERHEIIYCKKFVVHN